MQKRHPRLIDITGQKFDKLTALHVTNKTRPAGGAYLWLCECECGKRIHAESNRLRAGRVRSCGCLVRGQPSPRRKLVSTRETEYNIWRSMRARCNNPRQKYYPSYGGRGIRVCARWEQDFNNFITDMGRRPSSAHSIDRINNNGNYEPDNCRWATASEQRSNRRDSRLVEWEGERRTLTQWAAVLGIKFQTLYYRLRLSGWTVERAFTTLS